MSETPTIPFVVKIGEDLVEVCPLCGFKVSVPQSFVVWLKASATVHSIKESIRVCRSCGLSEFQKGHGSLYWFNPYYQAKARRYIKRGL